MLQVSLTGGTLGSSAYDDCTPAAKMLSLARAGLCYLCDSGGSCYAFAASASYLRSLGR